MAKSKSQLHQDAVRGGFVPKDSEADDYSVVLLETLLSGDVPAAGWMPSADKPIYSGVDQHPVLTQEDIDARNA